MGVVTYSLSRVYLQQHHFKRVLADIVRRDNGKTPIAQRNESWFVARCMELPSNVVQELKLHRAIHNPDDMDLEEGTFDGKLCAPRMLRYRHRTEILDWFNTHREWFLNDQSLTVTSGPKRLAHRDVWHGRLQKNLKKSTQQVKTAKVLEKV